jgi:hypothetical protein
VKVDLSSISWPEEGGQVQVALKGEQHFDRF